MSSFIREWLNLADRWFHVFAGILWVGQTYYFTWLDGQFHKAEKQSANAEPPTVWMVHSGGFYTVDKQKSLAVAPEQVRWFRWEALFTWLSGLVLLVLVYYSSAGLVDPDVANISQARAILIGVTVLIAGYTIRGDSEHDRQAIRAHIMITAVPKLAPSVEPALRKIPDVRTLHSVSGTFAALQAQHVHGCAHRLSHDQQSFSGRDLREQESLGDSADADSRRLGRREIRSFRITRARLKVARGHSIRAEST